MTYLRTNIWKIAVFASVIAFGLTRSIYIAEADILWQTRSGLDFLQDGLFVRPDTYSWVIPGAEYVSNSWLWNVVLALIYQATGFVGIAIFTGAVTSATLGLITYVLRLQKASWSSILVYLSILGLLAGVWMSGRPQIADYLLLAVAMVLTARISLKGVRAHVLLLMALVAILVLWNNLHLTGPVGAVCFAALYFLKQIKDLQFSWAELKGSVARTVTSLALLMSACLITPYGIEGMLKPFITVKSSSGIISEWVSPWTFMSAVNTISAAAVMVVAIILIIAAKKISIIHSVFALGLLAMASWQARWTPFMVILLAGMITHALDRFTSEKQIRGLVYIRTAGIALVLASVAGGLTTFIPQDRVSNTNYGYALVSEIPAGCKVFNSAGIGGPIALMRPDIKVSLDGRNDLYGMEEYLRQNTVAKNQDNAQQWLTDNGINCVLLNEFEPLNEALAKSSEWKLKAVDSQEAKLWIRNS